MSKLQNILDSYMLPPRIKRGLAYARFLDACKELKDQSVKLTNKNIAVKLNKAESYARQMTLKMMKEGKLVMAKKQVSLGGRKGALSREYALV